MLNVTLTITAAPELLAAISNFTNAVTASRGAAMAVQQPVQPQVPPTARSMYNETPVPTAAESYTMEQLAVAATSIVDAGRRTDLIELLSSFGVQALTALPKEQYGAFATQLRALGGKI